MSKKYIELEQAIKKIGLIGNLADFIKDVICDELIELPTIEVSEDCISRNYLEEQLQQIEDITAMAHIDLGEDPYDETEEITMPISTVRKIFKNAPSVLPKANKDEWVEEFSDGGWRWVKDEL